MFATYILAIVLAASPSMVFGGFNNVKNFGAFGNGVSDDREAIQAAIDDAVLKGKSGILFPNGTFRVSHATDAGARWSLDLDGVENITVMGQGPKSVVKLVDTTEKTGDWHVFILRNNCRKVVFKDLVIDGNRTGLFDPNEQSHGIEVEEGTEDLVIDRCTMRECFGDGVRLLGDSDHVGGRNVERLRIENCLFETNKRSGLSVQRALEQIIVANCVFEGTVTDQSIDFEPSGTDAPTDFLIQGCIIHHTNATPAVTLSGISGPDPLVRCKFVDNIVLGGNIFCTDVDQLTIQNNVVQVPEIGINQHIPIEVQRGGDSILITGNLLVNDHSITASVISLSEVNQRQVSRALVADNLCFTKKGKGIQLLSSDDVAIQNNIIVATGDCADGIFLRSQSSNMDHISIRDNDIYVEGAGSWNIGIRLAADPEEIHHVSVIGNSVRGATQGIKFEGNGFRQTPVCSLNRLDVGVTSPLLGISVLPEDSLVVGGATSTGGVTANSGAGRFLTGLGDPNAKVIGNVGDIFQRLDGTTGSTLYVKESGNGNNTGWISK